MGSYAVKVGVVDSGIDYGNEDLGNGAFGNGAKVGTGYNYYDGNPDPIDTAPGGHGTACAGIIGAQRNNGLGVAGLAGGNAATGDVGCQLVGLKVGDNTSYATDKLVAAITEGSASAPGYGYACRVLSNSYSSSTYDAALENAVAVAAQNNAVFVASSGNGYHNDGNGQVLATYPANFSSAWTIAVGASDALDQRASFSNYGNSLAVVAPGTSDIVYTTKRVAEGSYGSFNGTSAAAPHVAGLAALLLSANAALHPQDVDGIIKASADKVMGQGGPTIHTTRTAITRIWVMGG